MSGKRGKNQAFAVALVELERHGFGFSSFMNNHRFTRPRIHQLTLNVAPRFNFNVINTVGIFAGGNQKTASALENCETPLPLKATRPGIDEFVRRGCSTMSPHRRRFPRHRHRHRRLPFAIRIRRPRLEESKPRRCWRPAGVSRTVRSIISFCSGGESRLISSASVVIYELTSF